MWIFSSWNILNKRYHWAKRCILHAVLLNHHSNDFPTGLTLPKQDYVCSHTANYSATLLLKSNDNVAGSTVNIGHGVGCNVHISNTLHWQQILTGRINRTLERAYYERVDKRRAWSKRYPLLYILYKMISNCNLEIVFTISQVIYI